MANLEELILLNLLDREDDENDSGEEGSDTRRARARVAYEEAFAMSDTCFIKNYRLSKSLVRDLFEEVRPFISGAHRSTDLTVETKVLVALNFIATGSYQNCVGNHINMSMSQASVSKSLAEVVDALNQPAILNKYVKFPSNTSEMNIIAQRFYQLYGLSGITGAIDCTHVAIVPPPNNEQYDERSYVNRKGYHSINTQLICDADLNIINVNALFPGSTHDSYIWNQSAVLPVMQQIYQRGGTYYLIGDSGYGLRPWLQVPIPEPQSSAELSFNNALKSARATVERCNGVLKGRFRSLLKHRVLHYSPEKASKIINSCVVLHNICIKNNIPWDSDEGNNEDDLGLHDVLPQVDHRASDLSAGQSLRALLIANYFT